MWPRTSDHDARNFYSVPGARDSVNTFMDRAPMRRHHPSNTLDPDLPWLQAELRRLRTENAALKQEINWQSNTIIKAEGKSRQLVKELGCLKHYAERTEMMNPQLTIILVGLICRLFESIARDPRRNAYDLIPECLALIDQCPFMDSRLTAAAHALKLIMVDPQMPVAAATFGIPEKALVRIDGVGQLQVEIDDLDVDRRWEGLSDDLKWIIIATGDRSWAAYKSLYESSPIDLKYIAVLCADPRWLHNCSTWAFTPLQNRLAGISRRDPVTARPTAADVSLKEHLERIEKGIPGDLAPKRLKAACSGCPAHCPLASGETRDITLRMKVKDISSDHQLAPRPSLSTRPGSGASTLTTARLGDGSTLPHVATRRGSEESTKSLPAAMKKPGSLSKMPATEVVGPEVTKVDMPKAGEAKSKPGIMKAAPKVGEANETKSEGPKTSESKLGAPKLGAPKAESPEAGEAKSKPGIMKAAPKIGETNETKSEGPKIGESKLGVSKLPGAKAKAPKEEESKGDVLKVGLAKTALSPEGSKSETLKSGEPKAEISKEVKVEDPKAENESKPDTKPSTKSMPSQGEKAAPPKPPVKKPPPKKAS